MAKSFRHFREDRYSDEWGNDDDEFRSKKERLKQRKKLQRDKKNQKFSSHDRDDDE
jgi:hypothetical protein